MIAKISQETLAEMIGTTRSRVSFFMNKFRKLGFIHYNGGLEVHSSLLNLVLLISSLICLHSRGIFECWFLKECGDFLWGVLERAHGREHFSPEGLFAVARRASDRVRLQMVPYQLVWI